MTTVKWLTVFVALALLAVIVAHWSSEQLSLPLVIGGLLILAGGPAAVVLWDRVPTESPRRMPAILWIGLGLLLVGALVSVGGLVAVTLSAPLTPTTFAGGPRLSQIPVSRLERRAVASALPGLVPTLALGRKGETLLVLSRSGRPRDRLLLASWADGSLTLLNLAGNGAMGTGTPGPTLSWSEVRPHIGEPAGVRAIGPYWMAGTWVWIVPDTGGVYVVNAHTGTVTSS